METFPASWKILENFPAFCRKSQKDPRSLDKKFQKNSKIDAIFCIFHSLTKFSSLKKGPHLATKYESWETNWIAINIKDKINIYDQKSKLFKIIVEKFSEFVLSKPKTRTLASHTEYITFQSLLLMWFRTRCHTNSIFFRRQRRLKQKLDNNWKERVTRDLSKNQRRKKTRDLKNTISFLFRFRRTREHQNATVFILIKPREKLEIWKLPFYVFLSVFWRTGEHQNSTFEKKFFDQKVMFSTSVHRNTKAQPEDPKTFESSRKRYLS